MLKLNEKIIDFSGGQLSFLQQMLGLKIGIEKDANVQSLQISSTSIKKIQTSWLLKKQKLR